MSREHGVRAKLITGYAIFIAALVPPGCLECVAFQTVSVSPPPEQPAVQTVTINGFTILDDAERRPLDPGHRRFVVTSPSGKRHEVLVEIDSEAFITFSA